MQGAQLQRGSIPKTRWRRGRPRIHASHHTSGVGVRPSFQCAPVFTMHGSRACVPAQGVASTPCVRSSPAQSLQGGGIPPCAPVGLHSHQGWSGLPGGCRLLHQGPASPRMGAVLPAADPRSRDALSGECSGATSMPQGAQATGRDRAGSGCHLHAHAPALGQRAKSASRPEIWNGTPPRGSSASPKRVPPLLPPPRRKWKMGIGKIR